MATLYASAPGTGSGGSGTNGSPYANFHEFLASLSAGDIGIMKTGTYTLPMSWNSLTPYGGWQSGTAGSHITVQAEGHTDSTTKGITAGTSSVILKVAGQAINYTTPTSIAYWDWRGIEFDASNHNQVSSGYIVLNSSSNNITFQNCKMHKLSGTANVDKALFVEIPFHSTALLNNQFRYNEYAGGAGSLSSHFHYFRGSGNIVEHNQATGGYKAFVQFFISNPGQFVNDNIVRFNDIHDFPSAGSTAIIVFGARTNRNLIYGNVIYDCPTRNGIYFQAGSGVVGAAVGNSAVHNTITNCLTGIKMRDDSFASDFTNTLVANNILYNNVTNLDMSSYSTNPIVQTNATDGTDPVFTDAGADDYSLAAGSPYKTGGTVLGSPYDVDTDGLVRPQNVTPSLGAYEYDAGLTPEPPMNNYANPGGYTITVNTPTVLPGLSVTQDAGLTTAVWLSMEGTNATWTDVDTSGGATSN